LFLFISKYLLLSLLTSVDYEEQETESINFYEEEMFLMNKRGRFFDFSEINSFYFNNSGDNHVKKENKIRKKSSSSDIHTLDSLMQSSLYSQISSEDSSSNENSTSSSSLLSEALSSSSVLSLDSFKLLSTFVQYLYLKKKVLISMLHYYLSLCLFDSMHFLLAHYHLLSANLHPFFALCMFPSVILSSPFLLSKISLFFNKRKLERERFRKLDEEIRKFKNENETCCISDDISHIINIINNHDEIVEEEKEFGDDLGDFESEMKNIENRKLNLMETLKQKKVLVIDNAVISAPHNSFYSTKFFKMSDYSSSILSSSFPPQHFFHHLPLFRALRVFRSLCPYNISCSSYTDEYLLSLSSLFAFLRIIRSLFLTQIKDEVMLFENNYEKEKLEKEENLFGNSFKSDLGKFRKKLNTSVISPSPTTPKSSLDYVNKNPRLTPSITFSCPSKDFFTSSSFSSSFSLNPKSVQEIISSISSDYDRRLLSSIYSPDSQSSQLSASFLSYLNIPSYSALEDAFNDVESSFGNSLSNLRIFHNDSFLSLAPSSSSVEGFLSNSYYGIYTLSLLNPYYFNWKKKRYTTSTSMNMYIYDDVDDEINPNNISLIDNVNSPDMKKLSRILDIFIATAAFGTFSSFNPSTNLIPSTSSFSQVISSQMISDDPSSIDHCSQYSYVPSFKSMYDELLSFFSISVFHDQSAYWFPSNFSNFIPAIRGSPLSSYVSFSYSPEISEEFDPPPLHNYISFLTLIDTSLFLIILHVFEQRCEMEKKRIKEDEREKKRREKEKTYQPSKLKSGDNEFSITSISVEEYKIDDEDLDISFDDVGNEDYEKYFFINNNLDDLTFPNYVNLSRYTSLVNSSSSFLSLLSLEEDRLLIQLLNTPFFCGDEDEIIFQLLRYNKIKVLFFYIYNYSLDRFLFTSCMEGEDLERF
jgi:hypothetical protein